MKLEGHIEFENPIPVTAECLGKEFSIVIAGITGILLTPNIFKGFRDGTRKLGPLEAPEKGIIAYRDTFDWGSIVAWPNGDSKIRACKIILIPTDIQDLEELENKVLLEIGRWRDLLLENISVKLRVDFRGPARVKTYKNIGQGEFELFVKKDKNTKRLIYPTNTTINIFVDENMNLEHHSLKQIIEDTSNKKKPLLPFYFLLDAEKAIFEENYRKSILDCATAVEICLSSLINHLLCIDEPLKKHVESKANSLKLKRELMKVLHVQMPLSENECENNLDYIRNKLIHKGYSPTRKEGIKAYNISNDLLYHLIPKIYEL